MFKGGEEAGKYEQARNSGNFLLFFCLFTVLTTYNLDAIVSYMRKQAGPASIEVSQQEKWDKVKNNKQPLVIGYFR